MARWGEESAYPVDYTKDVQKSIADNAALVVDPVTLAHVEFEEFVGAAIAQYTSVWDQFKSA